MIRWPSICDACAHRRGETTCTAFPDGIPDKILIWGGDHRQPFPGDHGIRFDLAPGKQAEFDLWRDHLSDEKES